MPDVWSEIMSARLARREVTRRHADAAMGKVTAVKEEKPAAAKAAPVPAPVVEEKVAVVEEEAQEAPAPKASKKATASAED